jgi:hypothetical protein
MSAISFKPAENTSEEAKQYYARVVPLEVQSLESRLPMDGITLVGKAKSNAELFCSTSPKGRRRAYKKANPEKVKKLAHTARINVVRKDLAKNSKIMTISILIFGAIGSCGWIAGPVGGIPGTTLGVAAGATVGGVIIKKYINKKINIAIEISQHFTEWRYDSIIGKVYPTFKNFINENKEFQDFLCPISHDICAVPMLAPDKKTYDKSSIVGYIHSRTSEDDVQIESPFKNSSFAVNELVFDVEYCRKLIIKAQEVYKTVLQQCLKNEIKFGLQAVIQNTFETMEKIRVTVQREMWDDLDELVESKKITEEKRSQIIREATSQWDFRKSIA